MEDGDPAAQSVIDSIEVAIELASRAAYDVVESVPSRMVGVAEKSIEHVRPDPAHTDHRPYQNK